MPGDPTTPTDATTGREHDVAQLDAALMGEPRLRAVPSRPHEVVMAFAALRTSLPLALVVGAPAALLRGADGLVTALFVLVLVVGMFVLTGIAHGWAAGRGPGALQAVAMGGLFVRLWLYATLLAILRPLEVLDPTTLVIATPVVVFTLLAYEVRFVSSRREFLFIDVAARRRTDRKDRS
jgi:hypothetical protein